MSSRLSNKAHHTDQHERLRGLRTAGERALVLSCIGIVLICHLWFVGVWVMSGQPPQRRLYRELGAAFLHGQLALLQEPDPALLALPNPYDPSARVSVPHLMDASLYEGKYYVYFGPVPAVVLAAAKYALRADVGDEHLVFVFVGGLFLVQAILALKIWKRFFPDVSSLVVGASLLAIGLATPSSWLLALANTYGAAISGGALFFMAGLLATFNALDRDPISRPRLILAGACWAAAVGSRITQIVPVGLLILLVSGAILTRERKAGNSRTALQSLTALFIPLALGASALGWYNWARFGSVLETGVKFQLSGWEAPLIWQEHYAEVFSRKFVMQNLFNYMLAPPGWRSTFPYVSTVAGIHEPILASVPLPEIYHAAQITGLLYSAPFIVFSVFTIIPGPQRLGDAETDGRALAWKLRALQTAFSSSFVVMLAFFWIAERYQGDFVPALYILSVVGFWRLGRLLAGTAPRRALYGLLGLLLMGSTIVMSSLVALSAALERNPAGIRVLNGWLWYALQRLLGSSEIALVSLAHLFRVPHFL